MDSDPRQAGRVGLDDGSVHGACPRGADAPLDRATRRRPPSGRAPRAPARAALPLAGLLLLLCGLAGCAAPGSDIALAPFWSRAATADGGVDIEAAAGLWRQRYDAASGRFESLTVGPFYSLDRRSPERPRQSGPFVGPTELAPLTPGDVLADGLLEEPDDADWLSRYLVPLGFTSRRGGETTSLLLPVYLWRSYERADGSRESAGFTLLGPMWRSNERTGTEFAWFPFFGRLENLFTYEKLGWFLWPLFVYAERDEQVSYHAPWPLIGWVRGGGESSDHFLPFYSRATLEGRYERWALLWPFFHLQYNNLGGGNEEKQRVWWAFPLLGRSSRGSYSATSVLWPFFGYASDSDSGFWSWDGPWPFVRIQRGPDDVRRTRFWPLFSTHSALGLRTRTFLWPFIQLREEDTPEARRSSTWIVPLWQSWEREDLDLGVPTGSTASWRKLFPLFQHEREDRWRRGSFPTLDPFWRNELVDRHYAWAWKLYEWEVDGEAGTRRERGWAGLWRRERDPLEDRASLTFLWSRRAYRDNGVRVREHAALFGLLRWRVTADEGFAMLPPAFPGPGWPARGGPERP